MSIEYPRWRDDPSLLYQMIRNYLQLGGDDLSPLDHFRQMAQEREKMTGEARARLDSLGWKRLGFLRKWLFDRALRRMQVFLPFRENTKYYGLVCYVLFRRYCRELGRRWQESGILASRDDIFFLTFPEIRDITSGNRVCENIRRTVSVRKDRFARHSRLTPAFIVRSDGQRIYPPRGDEDGENRLMGTPIFPGRVTAKARVIRDPAEGAVLDRGEILVAPSTDPGWTPLFLTAGALVMEVGGVLSHGAIVAREYGIPAVVGVSGAAHRIRTGDRITVDGNTGTIYLHDPETLYTD